MINVDGNKQPSDTTPRAAAADKKCCLCSAELNTAGVDDNSANGQMQEEECTRGPLVKKLFLTLQLQYTDASPAPVGLCQRCMEATVGMDIFVKMVKDIEVKLQKQQERTIKPQLNYSLYNNEKRPGVDGNPGVFVKTEGELIIEVDPDANLDEDTEDDFSNESDTDDCEDVSMPSAAPIQPNAEQQMLATKTQTEQMTQAQLASGLQQQQSVSAGDLFNMDFVVKNTFLCQYCDMAFTGKEECSLHETMHNTALPFCCFFCRLQLASRQTLIVHIKEEHGTDRPYICITCEKGFCRRSDLKKHTIVHTGVRPYTCPVCLKGFSRNTNLTKHMRIHTSVKPHVCLSCPRSFSTHSELLRHVPTHAAIKPHQCSMCSAAFTRRDKLALHENSHYRKHPYLKSQQQAMPLATGGMMYDSNEMLPPPPQMDFNEQAMSHLYASGTGDATSYPQGSILAAQLQQQQLQQRSVSLQQQHQTTAKNTSGQKQPRQLNCDICSRSFTREIDLQQHQALHLDTLFMCKQCNIGFSRREKLLRHEQEQHAPQYPCEHCYMSFLKLEELQAHLKMHELQRNAEAATAAAAASSSGAGMIANCTGAGGVAGLLVAPPQPMNMQRSNTAADFNFYSQMVPTMHLGFYSETNIEGQNTL